MKEDYKPYLVKLGGDYYDVFGKNHFEGSYLVIELTEHNDSIGDYFDKRRVDVGVSNYDTVVKLSPAIKILFGV